MSSASSISKLWTPANIVTIVRIAGVPLLVLVMLVPWEQLFSDVQLGLALKPWVSALFFIVLSATDGVDGYLARSRNEVTNFGKFMDPLADKLLVVAVLLVLTEQGLLPSWVTLIVLFREFMISGLRMMAATKGTVIAASWYGKAKTVSQIIALTMFILVDALPALIGQWLATPFFILSWVVLAVSLVLTILSMADYFIKSKDVFAD